MEFKTAEISFRSAQQPTLKKDLRTPFAFSQHRRSLDQSTESYQESTQGFSWLGVKTEPFDGWLDTALIEFCLPDESHGDYMVAPGDSIMQEGEWLWFKVSQCQGVEPFSE